MQTMQQLLDKATQLLDSQQAEETRVSTLIASLQNSISQLQDQLANGDTTADERELLGAKLDELKTRIDNFLSGSATSPAPAESETQEVKPAAIIAHD